MLGIPEVQFLGHMVERHDINPLPEKVAAIHAFPRPWTVGQLMSYLGMVNFYRRFIKGAAGVLKPLTDALLRASGKAARIEWSPSILTAFKGSKQQMARAKHLAHLSVDASGTHGGAALQQEMSPGSLQPLGFFSRKLNTAGAKILCFLKRNISNVCSHPAFQVGTGGEAVLCAVGSQAPHLRPAQAV